MTQARMYDGLFSTSEITRALSDEMFLRCMLRFEVALTLSLEAAAVVPSGCAALLARIDVSTLDRMALSEQAAAAGNLCIPFVKMLTAAVAAQDSDAAAYDHWGATSQDVIDTALLLQIAAAWEIIERDLAATCAALADRVTELRHTVMPGRTWLQQGPPVTMGLKLATWLDTLQRHRKRMQEAKPRVFALQFGGAVGTLAPFGNRGSAIAMDMAARLNLSAPDLPWHTQRDRIAEIGTLLAALTGTLGKIARDVSLLMQTEVAEFAEPAAPGKGGSSTMPHKRNPVSCAAMLSAAARTPSLAATLLAAMVQEHERGLGGWHAEWETLVEIVRLTAGSLARALEIVRDGTPDAAAMQRNLDCLHGVTMAEAVSFALAEAVGKAQAHTILERVSRLALAKGSSLLQQLEEETEVTQHISPARLHELLRPAEYLGSTHAFIDAVLKRYREGSDHATR